MASIAMLGILAVPDLQVRGAGDELVDVPMLFMPSSLVYLLVLYTAADRSPTRGDDAGSRAARSTADTFGSCSDGNDSDR